MQITQLINIIPTIQTAPSNQLANIRSFIKDTYDKLVDGNQLSNALCRVAMFIVKLKDLDIEHMKLAEQCLIDIVERAIHHQFQIGADALRYIFDLNNQFYRFNHLDKTCEFPIGEDRQLPFYEPQVGEDCDVVKPYITSTNFCGWTRCTLLAKEGKSYTLLYANTNNPIVVKDKPHFAPLGSRLVDFEERMGLDIGSKLDAIDTKNIWYASTVVEVGIENGSKRVRVSYRIFDEKGDKVDSLGQRYFGLGPNEDDWIDVLSSRIQKYGKMHKKLSYQINPNQYFVDDTYDLIFEKDHQEKPIHAIMRANQTRSLTFLYLYRKFCSDGGHEAFLNSLQNNNINIDHPFHIMVVIANCFYMVPRMSLNQSFEQQLDKVLTYLRVNAKNLNNSRYDMCIFYIETLAKRLYSYAEKQSIVYEIRKDIALVLLKQNLQKQLVALRILQSIYKPLKQISREAKELIDFTKYVKQNQIFYTIYQQGVHQSILTRSIDLLRFLIEAEVATWNQLQSLWNLIPQSDLRGRAIIEKIFIDLVKTIKIDYVQNLLRKLLDLKETELTIDNLNLFRELKNREDLALNSRLNMCKYFWDCITVKSINIKHNIQEEVQKVFKGLINTLKDNKIRANLLKDMCLRLSEAKTLNNEIALIRDCILTYPTTISLAQRVDDPNIPQTINEAVHYLRESKIYQTLLKLVHDTKKLDKKNMVLQFFKFLFKYDHDDISEIVRTVYYQTGPSQMFLNWAKQFSYRIQNFFTEIFQERNVTLFIDLTQSGFQSLKGILFDINLWLGNLKIIYSKSQSNKSENQVPKLFVYTLKSPFMITGIYFLEELLFVVKNSKVYQQIIKLIIKFVVNLDESIQNQTLLIRKQFCDKIFKKIKQIEQQNIYNEKTKIKFDTYISFIEQLLSQTQIEGMYGIIPHFQTIQGEIISLKIQNIAGKQPKEKQFIFLINQNCSFWNFKVKISNLINEDASKIDILKYKNPIRDQNNGKRVGQLLCNNQNIKIEKKQIKEIPQHDLLNQDNSQLSQKFNNILIKWYQQFKNQKGQIGFNQLKNISAQCWKGSFLRQESKITQLLQQNDKDHKGYLTLQEFRQMFINKCIQNSQNVWRILYLSGYKNNLKHKDYIQTYSVQQSPRKILSSQQFYNVIFQFLSNQTFSPLHYNIYRLLGMVETDKKLKQLLQQSYQIQPTTCRYKLSYIIQIVMSLMTESSDYYLNFYKKQGPKIIISILQTFSEDPRSLYTLDNLGKMFLLPNLIRIINNYGIILYSDHKIVQFMSEIKINLLQFQQLTGKLQAFQKEQKKQSDFIKQKRLKLKQINFQLDWNKIQCISNSILKNLINNYNNEFLVKLTNQAATLSSFGVVQQNLNLINFINGVKSQSLNLRRTSQSIIYLHLIEHKQKFQPFLQLMLEEIPKQNKYIYTNFFFLLSKVIEHCIEINKNDQYFVKLSTTLLNKIYEYPFYQKRNAAASDKILLGLLINLNILINKKQPVRRQLTRHKHQLVKKCLFFYGVKEKVQNMIITEQMLNTQNQSNYFDQYIKCKHQDTRKVLYEIIVQLHKIDFQEDPFFFQHFILPIIEEIRQPRKSGHKSISVGLNNLGSICYLNSMIQVLNAIGPLRNTLMMINSDARLVNQIKNLFSYLFFSQRNDYVPKMLLDSFNPPINPGLQQDTTQFLNYLFDQLQFHIKDSPYSTILEQLFKGSQAAQMICHSCGAKRQNKQHFFSYSVQIQGKYDLKSALQGMHQGEVISDCLCENCGQRHDTTKRNVLTEVPNIFFIHLKRIVFNYDVFINTKIHTRLEFPNQLNFQPYTKQGLDLRESLGVEYLKNLKNNQQQNNKFINLTLHGKSQDSYLLKLKGVIVHSGTADVGHYYTILQKDNGWIKFDDSRVSLFNVSNFQSQCYGGKFQADQWGGFGSSINAYVLIYQKVVKQPIRFVIEGTQKVIPYNQMKVVNTNELYRQVWIDNHQLMLEDHLLSENYCKDFMNFVLKIIQNSPSEKTIYIISQLLFKICFYSGEVGQLQQLFLKNINKIDSKILSQFILSDTKKIFSILFHYEKKIRDFISVYISEILIYNFKHYPDTRIQIYKFLDEFEGQLHLDVSKNWMRCDGYFKMFNRIVNASLQLPQLYSYVLSKNFISVYIDFIMEKASPINISHKKYSVGSKSNPINFEFAINTILILLQRSYGFNGVNYQLPPPPTQQLYHLNDNDIICLSFMGFYQKMLQQRQSLNYLAIIIQRLCINNLGFSQSISRILLMCINYNLDCNYSMKDLLNCISLVLQIKDQYWALRAQFILGYAVPYVIESNLLTSLDDQRFVYQSTLHDLFPVQCLFAYAHINRLRNPLGVAYILSTILKSCSVSEEAMVYLSTQPAPSYKHVRYIDWIRPFLANVQGLLNLEKSRREQLETQIQISTLYLNDLQKCLEAHQNQIYIPLITGKIVSKQVISKMNRQNVQVIISDVQTYCIDSIPTGHGNLSLDSFLQFGLLNKTIDPGSNLLYFFKESKKTLALPMKPVEQAQDKPLHGLFDEEFQLNTQKMDIEMIDMSKKVKQNQPKIEKNLNQQQQEKIQTLTIENVRKNKYFKEISFHNKSDSAKIVTIYFQNFKNSNVIVPNKACFLITYKNSESLWLYKLNPLKDWGSINFNIKVQTKTKNNLTPISFKQYGNPLEQVNFKTNPESNEQPIIKQVKKIENKANDVEMNFSNGIQCSVCTLLNQEGQINCAACESRL